MNDSQFESICNNSLRLGYVSISASFPEKSRELIGKLSEYAGGETDATEILTKFLLVSVAADGVLSLEEFMLMRPYFEHLAGKSVEYDDAVWMFMDMGLDKIENFKEALDRMSEVYARMPADLREELVRLCILAIAADGKISQEEKVWVKQLCSPDPDIDAESTIGRILESHGKKRQS